MKALSLWQPWASLWLSPAKIHETRHWRLAIPNDGFWLAVHAAKRVETDLEPDLCAIVVRMFGADWSRTLPRGAIIGACHVTGCYPTETIRTPYWDKVCGNFDTGRFGFRRGDYRVLAEPVPYRGRQGLFDVSDLEATILTAAVRE